MKRTHVGLACGMVVSFMATQAMAQAQAPITTESAATGPDKSSAKPVEVERIVVTATRRGEQLRDVPGQVGAIPGDLLEEFRAKTLADFAAYAPGLSFESATPNTNRLAIRGITTGSAQLNSAVGIYLDDVPVGSSTPFGAGVFAPNLPLFDLRRIEVLNGPQGTLYGANALGGAVRFITEVPDPKSHEGRIEAEGGSTTRGGGNGALRAMVNAPFAEGRAALRVDGAISHDSGYVDDPDHGRKNVGGARTQHGRASILFKATPDLHIRLTGFGQKIRSDGIAVAFRDPVTHAPTQGSNDQSFASAQPSDVTLNLGAVTVDWDAKWARLTSTTAYQENKINTFGDVAVAYSAVLGTVFGAAANAPYALAVAAKTKRTTQEIRLTSMENKSFEWIVGGFYSRESTFEEVGIVNTADSQGRLLGLPLGKFELPSRARDYALFGDATLYITPQVDATLGMRYSWSNQAFTTAGSGLLVNPGAPTTRISNMGESDERVPTYMLNVRYRPTHETMVYARAASGYRPGGPNVVFGGAGTGNDRFVSDSLWNYELGLKQTFSGGLGYFNLSTYRIDWSKIQLAVNVGGVNQLVNGGDARVDGLEATLGYRVAQKLSLLVSGAYTDAKLTSTAPILGINYEGARLPLSPRFSLALAATYRFQATDAISGNLNVGIRHVGERTSGYEASATAPLYKLGAYNIVDLALSLRTESGWEIGPYMKNVFDKRGEVSAVTVTNVFVPSAPVWVTLTQPRTVGVVVGRSF